jgi:hypothetical protein
MKKAVIILLIVIAGMIVFSLPRHKSIKPIDSIAKENPPPTPKSEDLNGKQIIVFAFDGSKSLDMWHDSLDFAQKMKADGKPIHFTYFLSGVYFLSYKNRLLYHPPNAPAGTSLIGFADGKSDIISRIGYVNRAQAEGHEIGSHLNGHFNGVGWSAADWEQEFAEFNKLISNVNANNGILESEAKLEITPKEITGFRAPNLGTNTNLWPLLASHGFVYDTDQTGKLGEWPKKNANGFWEFAIPSIKYANTDHSLLSMDYNFYVYQTLGNDLFRQGTADWQKALDDVYASYVNYFDNNYNSTKAPVFIAHHFSKWNDGVYWEALKKFASTECGKPDVRCISYKELVDYLNVKH